jgi:hypothetical protein
LVYNGSLSLSARYSFLKGGAGVAGYLTITGILNIREFLKPEIS